MDISESTDDCDRPARTASLTTRPSDVSALVTRKSVMSSGSFDLSLPDATRLPNGPTPIARRLMNAAMISTNTPSAYVPPLAVRYQLTCGAALSAIVAIVPCTALGVPPGVNVGVAVTARRVTRCT